MAQTCSIWHEHATLSQKRVYYWLSLHGRHRSVTLAVCHFPALLVTTPRLINHFNYNSTLFQNPITTTRLPDLRNRCRHSWHSAAVNVQQSDHQTRACQPSVVRQSLYVMLTQLGGLAIGLRPGQTKRLPTVWNGPFHLLQYNACWLRGTHVHSPQLHCPSQTDALLLTRRRPSFIHTPYVATAEFTLNTTRLRN